MKTEILSILRSAPDFVSGQELCEKLGVSRTAVWKTIKKLQEEGYMIEGVNRKGYRLVEAPDVMTAEEITSCLEQEEPVPGGIDYKIYYEPEVNSTNLWAKHEATEGIAEGAVVVAEMQTAGRGRRGKSWVSPPRQAIYMSIILRPEILPEEASMLTLVLGLSTAQAIRKYYDLPAEIKWPNDVVLSGKKICGILTEMSTQMDYIEYVVAGIGINVNMPDFPEEVKDKATSLYIEKGERLGRASLLTKVLTCFSINYQKFLKTRDLSLLQEEYNEILVNRGKEVRVLQPNDEYEGVSQGINKRGELLVTKKDGTCEAVYAGEVSVRGLYGYV